MSPDDGGDADAGELRGSVGADGGLVAEIDLTEGGSAGDPTGAIAATMAELARAQLALGLLDAVGLEWDLDAGTMRATPYGTSGWIDLFEEGRLSENEFLGLLDDSSVRALREMAASSGTASATLHLRFAERIDGPALVTRWARQHRRPRRVLGVAFPAEAGPPSPPV